MLQTDDPNGMDMKYSNLLSGTWGRGGFSAFETVPVVKPAGTATISRVAKDTEALVRATRSALLVRPRLAGAYFNKR